MKGDLQSAHPAAKSNVHYLHREQGRGYVGTVDCRFKESLEREIKAGFAQMEIQFDNQAARLERHAALLRTGSRWTARMNDWSEKVDRALEAKDQQIAELRKRVEALENTQ